jgi:hypothetical protein
MKFVSFLFSAIVVAPMAYMLADNEAPYIYDVEHSYIKPSETMADHHVIVHWEMRINRICPGMVVRNIIDAHTGVKITYDAVPAVHLSMTDPTINNVLYLPAGILPGAKLYQVDGYFSCNLLQQFYPLHTVTPRIPFTILPSPSSSQPQ